MSTVKARRNVLNAYASCGWNDGMACGPWHARIAAGEAVRVYDDAAGFEDDARASYLSAYRSAREECERELGPGKAYRF